MFLSDSHLQFLLYGTPLSKRKDELHQRVNKDGLLEVFVEMPGVAKDTLDIEQDRNILIVKGVKKFGDVACEVEKSIAVSKSYDIAATQATLVDGILSLVIPQKKQIQPKPNKILVT